LNCSQRQQRGGVCGINEQVKIAVVGVIIRGFWDPKELIVSNYLSVRDDKIVSLAVIFNQPCQY
jgi:hypothetical protein